MSADVFLVLGVATRYWPIFREALGPFVTNDPAEALDVDALVSEVGLNSTVRRFPFAFKGRSNEMDFAGEYHHCTRYAGGCIMNGYWISYAWQRRLRLITRAETLRSVFSSKHARVLIALVLAMRRY